MKRRFQYKTYLCALFSSFAILLVGTLSLLENEAINYYTVLDALEKVIPATIVIGFLGWLMGSIIDRPRKLGRIGGDNLLLNELMKETGVNSKTSTRLLDPAEIEGSVKNEEILEQPNIKPEI